MAPRARTSSATLHDVAREAAVSVSTASRVLNGSGRTVQEEYRTRVVAAAAAVGYVANLAAQAVARGTTSTVVLLVSDIADPYFSGIASGVITAADARGLDVRIAVTDRDPEKELALIRSLRGARPRVVLLAGSTGLSETHRSALISELDAHEEVGGRVALIGRSALPFPSVLVDNLQGAHSLADELARLGYRRFAIIRGPAHLLASADRVKGFLDALAARDITVNPDLIIEAQLTRDGAFLSSLDLLRHRADDIDLIFAVTDLMAIGVASAMRRLGIEPGSSLALAGFDDIPILGDMAPGITTVSLPLGSLGEAALSLALRTNGPATDSRSLGFRVVLRASTPPR